MTDNQIKVSGVDEPHPDLPPPVNDLVVTVLGAAALSGAPRKSVAWVLSSLYLVVTACVAVIAALFAPGS